MAMKAKTGREANVRKVAKKVAGAKPARPGGTHVNFGLHGLGKIMSTIHDAGLGTQLGKHLGSNGPFVRVSRKSLAGIKSFVNSKPQLSDLADTISKCDCPPDDPGCVYIPG
jgi:hypothetical protein